MQGEELKVDRGATFKSALAKNKEKSMNTVDKQSAAFVAALAYGGSGGSKVTAETLRSSHGQRGPYVLAWRVLRVAGFDRQPARTNFGRPCVPRSSPRT